MKDTINYKELIGYLYGYVQRMSEQYKVLLSEMAGLETFIRVFRCRFCADTETANQQQDVVLPGIELQGGILATQEQADNRTTDQQNRRKA